MRKVEKGQGGYRGRKGHLTSSQLWIWAFWRRSEGGSASLAPSWFTRCPEHRLLGPFLCISVFPFTSSSSPSHHATPAGCTHTLRRMSASQNNLEVEEFYTRSILAETIFSASQVLENQGMWCHSTCPCLSEQDLFNYQ